MNKPQVRVRDGFVRRTGDYTVPGHLTVNLPAGVMRFLHRLRDFRMGIAITFSDQAEHERRDDEYGYSFLCRRKAKSLPQLIEFEATDLFNHFANCIDPITQISAKEYLSEKPHSYRSASIGSRFAAR